MSKIMKGKFKDMPRSRISEAVWAAVIGMAATHNAHASEADVVGDESDLQANLDALKGKKDDSEMFGMAAARHTAEENIIGDGSSIEHAGDEAGQVVETAQVDASQGLQQQAADEQVQLSDGQSATSPANAETATEVLTASVEGNGEVSAAEDLDMDSVDAPAGPIVAGLEFDAGLLGFLGVAAVGAVAYAASDSDDDDAASDSDDDDAASDSDDDDAAPAAPATPLEGTAIDGYVAGATVWADKNGDGQMTSDETTVTDSNGNFSFDDVDEGTTVTILAGGRDVMTGEIVETDMVGTAATGADIVVSPLTTLIASGADEAELKEALGLDASVDLATFDPIEAITSDDAGQQALGESIFVAAQQVMTALQAGVADGGTVDSVATSLATNINNAAEDADFSDAVTASLDDSVAAVVNNVNTAIEDSLSEGNLAAAINSGSFETLAEAMDVVAIAQTQMVNAVEQAAESDVDIDVSDWTADAIETASQEWTPELNEDNFDFLVEQGLSLEGADLEITDADVLDAILNSDDVVLTDANITLDDGIQGEGGDIDALTDALAASTGTDVVVTELGDY